MNSWSKNNYEPCKKEDRYEERYEPCKKEEKKCETFVKCGFPGTTTIPAATVVGTPFTLTSFSLDTSCICDPRIKLDFASNLITTAFTGAISIQVFKQCRNQLTPTPVGPSWTYSQEAAVTAAETFSFFICDQDICGDGDCCTYTVVATVTVVTAGTLALNNTTLSAIVSCGENSCNKKCNRGYNY